MPRPFTVVAAPTMLQLDETGHAQASFAVRNVSGEELRGRVRLVPQDATVAPWLLLVGNPERDYGVDALAEYTVQVAVPAKVKPGIYTFRLDAAGVVNPDENFTEGPTVAFTVIGPTPPPTQPPWLLIGGAAVAVLVVIGIVAFILWPRPVGNFDGSWVLNFGTMQLTQNGSAVQGPFHNSFDNTNGNVQGTVANNTFTGQWTGNGAGSLVMTVSGDDTTVDGIRSEVDHWCGARSGKNFPSGCSFAGTWRSAIDGAQFTMNLTRVMSDVMGTYALVTTPTLGGTLTGTLHFNGVTTVLAGSYAVVPARTPTVRTGTMQFFLDGPNATQFRGSWAEPPSRSGAWCGGRADGGTPVPSPVPCRAP